MHDMRFNSPESAKPESSEQSVKPVGVAKKTGKSFLSFTKTLLKVLVVLALLYGAIIGSKYFIGSKSADLATTYSAVFLSNGQVYFGKIISNKKDEIVLKDVYYLQSSTTDFSPNGAALQGSQFTLVKLGQELHGPTDELYINKYNVLFYEYLRGDSQVVKTIEGYKNQ